MRAAPWRGLHRDRSANGLDPLPNVAQAMPRPIRSGSESDTIVGKSEFQPVGQQSGRKIEAAPARMADRIRGDFLHRQMQFLPQVLRERDGRKVERKIDAEVEAPFAEKTLHV